MPACLPTHMQRSYTHCIGDAAACTVLSALRCISLRRRSVKGPGLMMDDGPVFVRRRLGAYRLDYI